MIFTFFFQSIFFYNLDKIRLVYGYPRLVFLILYDNSNSCVSSEFRRNFDFALEILLKAFWDWFLSIKKYKIVKLISYVFPVRNCFYKLPQNYLIILNCYFTIWIVKWSFKIKFLTVLEKTYIRRHGQTWTKLSSHTGNNTHSTESHRFTAHSEMEGYLLEAISNVTYV